MGDMLSGFAAMKAGQAQAYEYELQQKHTEVAAAAESADRKERLLEALSAQNASAGARNLVAFSGSPLAIMAQDQESERIAGERSTFNTRLSNRMSRMRQRSAKDLGYLGFGAGTIKSGVRFASIASTGGGGGGKVNTSGTTNQNFSNYT